MIAGSYLVLSLVLACLATWDRQQHNAQRIDSVLSDIARRVADDIERKVHLYQYGLRGARGAIMAAGDSLSKETFQAYAISRDIETEFPGALGFGFIRRVPVSRVDEFIREVRRKDFPDFQLKQFEPHSEERSIIRYFEPLEANKGLLGMDTASYQRYRNMLVKAMQFSRIQLSPPYLLNDQPGHYAYDLVLPVYSQGETMASAQERLASGIGWVFVKLDLGKSIPFDGPLEENQLYLVLTDVTEPQAPQTVFRTIKNYLAADLPMAEVEKAVFGRQWQFRFFASPRLVGFMNLTSPSLVFTLGVFIALAITAAYLGFSYNRQLRQDTQRQQNFTSAIITSSSDAIISCDIEGIINSWNPGAEKLFRYSAQEAIGVPLMELIIPSELQAEELGVRQRILSGEYVPHFNTRRQRKHGQPVEVSVAIAPVLDGEKVIGYSKTLRDITDEVMTQRQIVEINKNLEALVERRTKEVAEAHQTVQEVLDNIPSRVAYWDAELCLIMANKASLENFSYQGRAPSLEQALGQPMQALMSERGYAFARNIIARANQTRQPFSEEFSLQGEGGDPIEILVQLVPSLDESGVKGYYSLTHDVSELNKNRRQIEALTRENQILLNTINEQLLYSVSDLQGKIIDVNENCCRVLGYRKNELIGQDSAIIRVDEYSDETYDRASEALLAGKTWRGEVANRCRDGSIRWFDSFVSPFVNKDNGEIERIISLRVDITERRQARQEINRVNAFLNGVLEASSEVAIIGGSTEGLITLFNSGAENMLGYRAEEMVGKKTPAVFHDAEEVIARGKQLSNYFGEEIAGFDVFVFLPRLKGSEVRQWTYVRKDGTRLQVSLAVTAMYNDQNEISGFLGVAVDITAQEKSRQQLEATRDQLAIAAEVAELGIWSLELPDRVMEWNQRMFEIYQQPLELQQGGLSGKHWAERVHPDDLPMVEERMRQAIRGGRDYDPVFRVILPSGEVRSIQSAARVEFDSQGNPSRITGINRDITQQLNLEYELRRAKELADSSNAAKSSFLANMSHEIRTPINAVLGMLKLAKNTPLNPRQKDYIVKADVAARTLLDLLNDILDVSKIEAGRLDLDICPVDIEQMMRDLAAVLDGYHSNREVELNFDIDPALPRYLMGDPLRIKQVLINLASNALKFTEQGLVVVRLQLLQLNQQQAKLRISVMDTGIGISEQQQPQVFDDFTQAEASTSRRYGGTGLGLVICKRLTEMMGSDLHLESQLGKGSHFWFDLALEIVDENIDVPAVTNTRVLIVEDNSLVAEIHKKMLSGMGYQVDIAENASTAIGRVQVAIKQQQPYQLILLDWLLPDINGDEAAAIIVGDLPDHQVPKIILLTAHSALFAQSSVADRVPCCDRLISKPVTARQLHEAISQVLNEQPEDVEAIDGVVSNEKVLAGLQLLVVEDNAMNRQVAEELLTEEGAHVSLANDGREGVGSVLANPDRYDLVIMDMQMPVVDGLEATRQIRADERCAQLPILAMTANVTKSDRDACLAAGMNDHVGKPIELEELIPKILRLVNRDTRKFESEKSMNKEPENAASLNGVSDEWKDVVLKRFGGNERMFLRVQPKFYSTIDELLQQLAVAIEQQHRQSALEVLHTIKGSSATMGAASLSRLAGELEQELKGLNGSSGLGTVDKSRLQQLRALFEDSAEALQNLADSLADSEEQATQASLSDTELKNRLEELLILLQSNNMQALAVMEAVHKTASANQRKTLEILNAQVNGLHFTEAIDTLGSVLREI